MRFLRNLLGRGKTSAVTVAAPAACEPAHTLPRLQVGWASDVGEVRRHNEDMALVITAAHDGDTALPMFGLFVLADGMGGHQAGEVASSLASRTVAYHVMRELYLPALIDEQDSNRPSLNEVLVNAVQTANEVVADQVPGGGTTLTCALVIGSRAYVAHVGDSRAYIVTDKGLDQITHDHSLVDRLIELGQLTRDEAADHPQKNVLYRAVGQTGVLEVDTYVRTIPPGGRLLLCTDGLWGSVSEAEVIRIITANASLQAACESLVAAANRAGGRDNITAILVEPPS